MINVRVHFVGKDGVRYKEISLQEFSFGKLPRNIVFFTVLDEFADVRYVFVVENRTNIRERGRLDVEQINLFGEGWSYYISCRKAEVYITSMVMIRVMFKILKDSRSSEFKKLSKRIGGFSEKKGIV